MSTREDFNTFSNFHPRSCNFDGLKGDKSRLLSPVSRHFSSDAKKMRKIHQKNAFKGQKYLFIFPRGLQH